MASCKIFIFLGFLALGFLNLAARNIGTKSSSGQEEGTRDNRIIELVTHSDQKLIQSNLQDSKFLSFDIDNDSYDDFIQRMRDTLNNSNANAHNDTHGVAVLIPQSHAVTPETAQWLEILLVSHNRSVTVMVDRTNLYIRGYGRSGSDDDFFWELTDTHLIPGSRDLGFSGSYSGASGLQSTAGVSRSALPLGYYALESAIYNLADTANPLGDSRPVARSLLILTQMIAEAARFRTIAEHISENFWSREATIDSRMLAMENGWIQLSTSFLHIDRYPSATTPLPNIPAVNPTEVYTYSQALAVLGILGLRQIRDNSATRSLTPVNARILMNLEYMRVNNIGGEGIGELFGTVRVYDGWYGYTFYNRSSDDYQSISPGGLATLTDPFYSHAVSGADAFNVSVDLYDYNPVWSNNKIAQGKIVWDGMIETVSFANYDRHLQQVVRGEKGDVTVGYSVISDALSVTINVLLANGDHERWAEVYGTLRASQVLGGSIGSASITLFDKPSNDYVVVREWDAIPLIRRVIAASTTTKLTITADLWDYDPISSDDEIAQGSVDFTVRRGEQRQYIYGKYGEVQVAVICV